MPAPLDQKAFFQRFAPALRRRAAAKALYRVLCAVPEPGAPLSERLGWSESLGHWLFSRAPLAPLEGSPSNELEPTRKARYVLLICQEVPAWREAVGRCIASVLVETSAVQLLCQTGLPAEHGFVSEAMDRLTRKVLPAPPDERDVSELLARIFRTEESAAWLGELPPELLHGWVSLCGGDGGAGFHATKDALADAVALLSAQAAALGTSEAMRSRSPGGALRDSPFLRLPRALDALLAAAKRQEVAEVDAARAECRRLFEACRGIIRSVLEHLETSGVSVNLVYRLELLTLLLDRLEQFKALMVVQDDDARVGAAARLLSSLILKKRKEKSLGGLVSSNLHLLARKIVERSGETGEHYITQSRGEQLRMLLAACGGGALTAGTTFIKFALGAFSVSLFAAGLLAGVNYAASFVAMQFLGFTLATKQPSATAAALAGALSRSDHDLNELVDLIARTTRSQLAAVVGNLGAVIPAAIGIDMLVQMATGQPFLTEKSATYVWHSLDPLHTGTAFYAFLTGIVLWMGSVAGGWLENWSTYRRLPDAIAGQRFLRMLVGQRGARWVAGFYAHNISGIGTNVTLGMLLGLLPVFGTFLGLPIDVRHITLSTGSLTFAALSQPHVLGQPEFYLAVSGLAVIAFFNFTVSFMLALTVAMRARSVERRERFRLLGAVLKRLVTSPLSFVIAPRGVKSAHAAHAAPAAVERSTTNVP